MSRGSATDDPKVVWIFPVYLSPNRYIATMYRYILALYLCSATLGGSDIFPTGSIATVCWDSATASRYGARRLPLVATELPWVSVPDGVAGSTHRWRESCLDTGPSQDLQSATVNGYTAVRAPLRRSP